MFYCGGTLLKHNENSQNLPKSIKELPATIKKEVRFDIFYDYICLLFGSL